MLQKDNVRLDMVVNQTFANSRQPVKHDFFLCLKNIRKVARDIENIQDDFERRHKERKDREQRRH